MFLKIFVIKSRIHWRTTKILGSFGAPLSTIWQSLVEFRSLTFESLAMMQQAELTEDGINASSIFTRRAAMLAWYWESSFCPSACLSVHHMLALWQNQTVHYRYFDTSWEGNRSSFLTSTAVGGRRPLSSDICAQSDPPPFEKHRLWQISAYNVSTIRGSEKGSVMTNRKSTIGFQRPIDGVCMLPEVPMGS